MRLTLLACLATTALAEEPDAIIDCHVHLWDHARSEGLTWIKKDDKVLNRSFLPKDHELIARANGVTGIVVVQAGQSLPDNQWNLDITAHNPRLYRGIIGNLSTVIGKQEFRAHFEKLCENPRYLGYRLSGKYSDTLTDAFFDDLRLTMEKDRVVEFLATGYSLTDITEVARRLPKLRILVNHLGGVKLDGSPLKPEWIAQFRALAQHANVCCKLSALFGRWDKQPAPQVLAPYTEVLDLAFECFGADRLIYGSDWPVSEQTADYAAILRLTRAFLDPKGRDVSEKVFHKNAERFHRLDKSR